MLVTPLYAGILTLLFVLLSVRVMNLRRHGIVFGDNNDAGITRINGPMPFDVDVFQWHHFAFIKSGATKQVWVNGTLAIDGTGVAWSVSTLIRTRVFWRGERK